MTALDADTIVDLAVGMAEVDDPDTEAFRSNLDLLVDCLDAEAGLRPEAVEATQHRLAMPLRNRIEVSHWAHEHPEILDEPIEEPLFLTGLPRSGTTYFQYLFDPEPSMRMLRNWEGRRPCPPPGHDPDSARDRIARYNAEALRNLDDPVRSKLAQIHLSDVDGPEECVMVLDQTFANVGHYWTYRIPTYLDRCVDTLDLRQCYEFHKLELQLLQWKREPLRWVLKWPCHLVALDAICDVYPDASFVVTHRDPVRALASNCSLTAMLRHSTAEHVDLHEIGRQMKDMIHLYLRRLVDFDERFAGTISHVDYQTAVERPEMAVEKAFADLGIEMTDSFSAAITAWRQENPRGKRGTHEYALEDYGLDAGEVAEEYAFYTERYDVPAEGSR